MNNRYTIQRELGQGGMAIVYLAEDTRLNAQVALKVLRPEFASNGHIHKRFASEAKNMFRMSHPNIIKVNDLIDDEETVAIVMEYVEGETLKEYIERKGKLNDDEIRKLLLQMLDALDYVHEQKLVHRDIKPSNFMITPSGKVKLMDFGIAKQTDPNSSDYTSTGTTQQMGTPMYMSPEQVHETKNVTAQSDIYSLGVVLWQMVTGKRPYDTKTLSSFQLQSKIVNEPLENTSTQWDSIIRKSTAKEISQRYYNAAEFKSEIFLTNKDLTFSTPKEDATIIDAAKSNIVKMPQNSDTKSQTILIDQKNLNREKLLKVLFFLISAFSLLNLFGLLYDYNFDYAFNPRSYGRDNARSLAIFILISSIILFILSLSKKSLSSLKYKAIFPMVANLIFIIFYFITLNAYDDRLSPLHQHVVYNWIDFYNNKMEDKLNKEFLELTFYNGSIDIDYLDSIEAQYGNAIDELAKVAAVQSGSDIPQDTMVYDH
jgi:serine/threonine protein kinase